ncbi:MAG TPA: ATP-binding protein [Myxococcota bacterium]|nr:ATP-binding protein [Myxococcota bacterium]
MPTPLDDRSKAELVAEIQKLRAQGRLHDQLQEAMKELASRQDELDRERRALLETRDLVAAARDRYAQLFVFAPIPCLTLDMQGLILEANLAASQLLGRATAQLQGRPMLVFVSPPDRRTWLDHLARCRRGERSVHVELEVCDAEPASVPVELTLKQLATRGGERLLYAALVDLSLRKRDEAERFRAEQERQHLLSEGAAARASNEAKDRFLAVLSHELRRPLTPILLAVDLLETTVPPAVAVTLGMIRRNVKLEARLIDDLLDVTRISQGKVRIELESVDLHELVSDVVGSCASELEAAGQVLSLELKARKHHVRADPTRLRQVFANLLQNAMRATPKGGRIWIASRDAERRHVSISIEDSGPGIPAADRERVFEPFEQGEREAKSGGGLGLGLSICRGLVLHHGGTIAAVDSAHGARFQVDLATIAPPEKTAPTVAARAASASSQAILVVEDDPDTADTLNFFLCAQGYKVTMARSVSEAMSHLEREFDVLVSDLRLPDGTGYELMTRARKHGSTRGIAISGYGSHDDLARSRASGFERHLVKPVSGADVVEAIEELDQE